MSSKKSSCHGYRFPAEIISHSVWLYHRFCLSLRDVEELLAERGIEVSYESIRHWCARFGPESAALREIMPTVPRCSDRYANNRAEVSHEPTRQRERLMRGFKSIGQAQRFFNLHAEACNLFRIGRHLMKTHHYPEFRSGSYSEWRRLPVPNEGQS